MFTDIATNVCLMSWWMVMCKREKGIRFLIPGGQTKREGKREPQMEKVIVGGCLLNLEGTLVLKFNGEPS